MPFRLSEPQKPARISLDGKIIVAEDGEPIAHALLAAGEIALARSPKFHRPRGPACLRGACDGCLMRVDGESNVMTCLSPAHDGTTVVAQNNLGSRKIDLLRMTDWFFPDGMNHHELFAGVPGVQGVMQAFARRVAGLGRLPEVERAPRRAIRRACDVLVVGGGPAGLAAAAVFAEAGRSVEVLEDGLTVGGSLLALRPSGLLAAVDAATTAALARGSVRLRARTVAGATFPDGVLVVGPAETEVLEARVVVFAPGAHDGIVAFENNDLPGIFSARAGLRLLSAGIAVGERVVVAIAEGGGPYGDLFQREVSRLGVPVEVTVVEDAPTAASASTVTFAGNRSLKADALLVDAPRSPSFELCAQAGAELEHIAAGFLVRAPGGRIRRGVYAVGEVTGAPLEASRILEDARTVYASACADGV